MEDRYSSHSVPPDTAGGRTPEYGASAAIGTGKDARERDIVVAGGSAGSIEALRDIVGQLRPDTAIALFVVVHLGPTSRSRLPEILARAGPLPARHAQDGDAIEPGRILVAPPDWHLLLHGDGVRVGHGPRENSTRPALDPLFRSAAAAFGPRVCGVVLSGNLDDGSEGLRLVAAAGGLAIVQDPQEAQHPEMPLNALNRVPTAEVLTANRIRRRLARLARTHAPSGPPVEPSPAAAPPLDVQTEGGDADGAPSGLTCPECGGLLWAEPHTENLHCRVGHRCSLESLWTHSSLSVEQPARAAVRALREDASLAGHLAAVARASGSGLAADRFERRRLDAARRAEVLQRLLSEIEPQD